MCVCVCLFYILCQFIFLVVQYMPLETVTIIKQEIPEEEENGEEAMVEESQHLETV